MPSSDAGCSDVIETDVVAAFMEGPPLEDLPVLALGVPAADLQAINAPFVDDNDGLNDVKIARYRFRSVRLFLHMDPELGNERVNVFVDLGDCVRKRQEPLALAVAFVESLGLSKATVIDWRNPRVSSDYGRRLVTSA